MQADSVPGENPLPGLQTALFLLRPHTAERKTELTFWFLIIPPQGPHSYDLL